MDDRSTALSGPSVHTAIEQEATLRIPPANMPMLQPLPPAHLVIQPQTQVLPQPVTQSLYLPSAQSVAPPPAQGSPNASAPATHAPHMILSATPQLEPGGSSPMSSARVQSVQSSAPPSARHNITAPDMSHRTPSEQAVIQALQAGANYPESRDFVETVSRQMPGVQNFLGATGQPEGCLGTRGIQGQSTNPPLLVPARPDIELLLQFPGCHLSLMNRLAVKGPRRMS